MYTDLFSSLDGARSPIFWLIPLLATLWLFPEPVWKSNLSSMIKNSIASTWLNKNNSRFNSFTSIITTLFLFLLINNVLGLTPITYTLTSNLFVMSSIACLLWLTLLLSGFSWSPSKSLAHLAPSGAPMLLMPFLVLIESISILIRPLTLTVRLIANISAGHIVLGLLSNTLSSYVHSPMLFILLMLSIGYTLFEFFVSVIQAYIFTLLVTLYSAEHPYSYSLYKTSNC